MHTFKVGPFLLAVAYESVQIGFGDECTGSARDDLGLAKRHHLARVDKQMHDHAVGH